ncbi:MAG: [LysW]-aminoadipate kinase [Anaerolineae bacterium]|jgi:acetylglutamate/LysW-gamma-L-alpha-aminoadipate kinase|nr:[LysW]-aminoadipate kinase [Anaerolineae bacterium]
MSDETLLVVKLGGGAGLDVGRSVADLARLAPSRPLVIVHGVSAVLNRLCEVRGVPVKTLTSPSGHTSRYTDALTRDLFVEAAHLVGAQVVAGLAAHGIAAEQPHHLYIRGERKEAIRAVIDGRIRIIRDDYTGSISAVDAGGLRARLAAGVVPVLPPLALSPDGLLNIDGDRAAAAVAGALGAADLVILSNVRGLYARFPDEASLVAHVPRHQLQTALEQAQGRMKRKVLGAEEALMGGVRRVIISDGRTDAPVTAALAGAGTHFD